MLHAWKCFLSQHISFLCQILGIGLHAMSGTATGPGPAPGIPGHTAAITPKTWSEGREEYNTIFLSYTELHLNGVGREYKKDAGKKGKVRSHTEEIV